MSVSPGSHAVAAPSYFPQLDALRALAVTSVIFSHWFPKRFHFGLPFGRTGVILFFVLSGFLITGILLRCRSYDDPGFALRGFYGRRFLRIFPLYYLVIGIGLLIGLSPIAESFGWHVLYGTNFYVFFQQEWPKHIGHFWTLAVEEQFYLVWPTVLLFVSPKHVRTACLGLIGIGVVSRLGLPLLLPAHRLHYVLTPASLTSMGLGAYLAYVRETKTASGRLVALSGWSLPVLAGMLIASVFEVSHPMFLATRDIVTGCAAMWLVDRASIGFSGRTGWVLTRPPLLWVGTLSYGLYVLHTFSDLPLQWLGKTIGSELPYRGMTGICCKTVVTLLAATLSWRYLESPLLRLKSRFPYRRPQPTVGEPRRLAA